MQDVKVELCVAKREIAAIFATYLARPYSPLKKLHADLTTSMIKRERPTFACAESVNNKNKP